MPFALQTLAAAAPEFLRLGRLQLPVFGAIATAGLLAALALSQRTAPLAGVNPDRLWDVGILAVVSAFAVSRLLLFFVNLQLFLAHPLLVLAQPSLTFGGLVLTALIVVLWLRHKHLPLARVLDAWAAPAALLAAILQLGHFFEGTDAGMPTTLAWGVHRSGDFAFARVHPVQLYAAAMYGVLSLWALRLLAQRASLTRSVSRAVSSNGAIAALALLVGGLLSFCLSFLRQPYDLLGDSWLDPSQYAALTATLAGIVLFAAVTRATRQPVATPAPIPAEEPC